MFNQRCQSIVQQCSLTRNTVGCRHYSDTSRILVDQAYKVSGLQTRQLYTGLQPCLSAVTALSGHLDFPLSSGWQIFSKVSNLCKFPERLWANDAISTQARPLAVSPIARCIF